MNTLSSFTTSSETNGSAHQERDHLEMRLPRPRAWPGNERRALINREMRPTLLSASHSRRASMKRPLLPGRKRRRMRFPHGHILLVDPNPIALGSLTDLLNAQDYFVMPAANSREVLAFANTLPVDLALLDLDVLDRNSWKTLSQLTRDHPHLPVILTTAQANHLPADLGDNTRNLLKKPLRRRELLRTVKKLLRLSGPVRVANPPAMSRGRRRCAKPTPRGFAISTAPY